MTCELYHNKKFICTGEKKEKQEKECKKIAQISMVVV